MLLGCKPIKDTGHSIEDFFQRDEETFIEHKEETQAPVPEPLTILMFGSGALYLLNKFKNN